MESHKEWIAGVFDRASSKFGEKSCSYFNHFGERLVQFAQLSKNEKVLDVATGKGAVLSAAARFLNSQGKLVGIDISAHMLQEAKKRLPSWVELKKMDAEHLDFADQTFDVIFCAFAIYFFPNVQAVLAEFKRVLKPGGRLLISSFGKRHSLSDWAYNRCRELGASRQMRINSFETEESLKKELELANFSNMQIHTESNSFSFENIESWWDSFWTHGSRAMLEQLTPKNLEIIRNEAFALAKQLHPTGKIDVEHRAIFISVHKSF